MVGIGLLTLVPGRLGGSETYVRELLRGLGRVGAGPYRVVVPPVAAGAGEGLPTEVAAYRSARTTPQRLAAMADAALRPGRLRPTFAGADVVHFPLTIELPRLDVPKVVTLHDLQHLDLPAMFPRAERRFRTAVWHPSLRRAERVIVISEFVRRQAVELLALDDAKLRVVPLGLDHAALTPGEGEREPFLLYPARGWPHKNHARLFEAFALVRHERPELRLLLTGAAVPGVPEGVESLGHVQPDELVALLRRASALVFPSLYEGFGLPPLEAMACGCPVACSDAGALPETVDGAARLFDPHDPRAIADAVLDVLASPDEWRRRGLEHAARYSWDATARATDAVYAELR